MWRYMKGVKPPEEKPEQKSKAGRPPKVRDAEPIHLPEPQRRKTTTKDQSQGKGRSLIKYKFKKT